jgi:hypothetical protein
MDDRQPHGSIDRPITRQCTATSKRSGTQCRKHAMRGRTVCLAHGGRTPRGAASPNFKTGRYSRSLPGHLVAAYEQVLHDPALMSLRDEIALTDAMIGETLSQITEEMPWAKERKIFAQVRRLIEQRRKLVESEVRHIVLAREVMTADEALALVRAMIAIVSTYLPDPQIQAAIAENLHALISSQSTEAPLGAHRFGGHRDSAGSSP